MLNVKLSFIFLFLLLFSSNSFAQEGDNLSWGRKVYIGVWKCNMEFKGIFSTELYKIFNKDSLHNIIKEKGLWYILESNDSIAILLADKKMKTIQLSKPEFAWYNSGHTFMQYIKDRVSEPEPIILPDGHWFSFATAKDYFGLGQEFYVKDHKLDRFCKSFDLKTQLPKAYFEIENGMLNGITFGFSIEDHRLRGITRYKDGVIIEVLYDRIFNFKYY